MKSPHEDDLIENERLVENDIELIGAVRQLGPRPGTRMPFVGYKDGGDPLYRWEINPVTRSLLVLCMREWEGLPEEDHFQGLFERCEAQGTSYFTPQTMQVKADEIEQKNPSYMDLNPAEILCLCNAITSAGGLWNAAGDQLSTDDDAARWMVEHDVNVAAYTALLIQERVALATVHQDIMASQSKRHAQRVWEDGVATHRRQIPKWGRNQPCPCGSNKKFKKCCGRPGG